MNFVTGLLYLLMLSFADIGLASVETTLTSLQAKLIGTILPLVAILGLVFASFSFVQGKPEAKTHFLLAMTGVIIGFGAPAIIAFLRGVVH